MDRDAGRADAEHTGLAVAVMDGSLRRGRGAGDRHCASAGSAARPNGAGIGRGWCETLEATRLPTGTLRRAGGGAVANLPGYAEGAWWVQDAGAALPVRLLGDVAGLHVLDLCAAPGGKTAQLADAGAHVTAIDRSGRRLERLVANLRRLSLPAATVAADAETWRPEQPVDAILLDAPCTATGAIRRHPDVPHLKRPADVLRLAAIQERLLRAAIEMLRPGGVLVYCTARSNPEEGRGRSTACCARAPRSSGNRSRPRISDTPPEWITEDGDLRTLPFHFSEYDGIDGFYGAASSAGGNSLAPIAFRPAVSACLRLHLFLVTKRACNLPPAKPSAASAKQSGRRAQRPDARVRSLRPRATQPARPGAAPAGEAPSLLTRLRRDSLRALAAGPLYRHTLIGRVPADLRVRVGERWPGDAKHGEAILSGEIVLAGQLVKNPMPVWFPPEAGNDWSPAGTGPLGSPTC